MNERLKHFLIPIGFLSSSLIGLAGVVIVTTAAVLWLFLAPSMWGEDGSHPYVGILVFVILPLLFFAGLVLMPVGVFLQRRRGRPLPEGLHLRRLAMFVGATTFVNVVLASQFGYRAVTYMDSVSFCGQTCHTVMEPEFTAYQNSPHSRVECVKCHIGPGQSWYVRSKLSGTRQIFAVTFNTHPRPIPVPVTHLRPARETCETCHWPQRYGADRLRVITRFADDETNTPSRTVLLMRLTGDRTNPGIHAAHAQRVRYGHADVQRQKIPWVEYQSPERRTVYAQPGANPANLQMREMDCLDCHTRPSHSFDLPDRATDRALLDSQIDVSLPFARKKSVEILKAQYASRFEAARRIPEDFERFYRETYPDMWNLRRAEIGRSAQTVLGIYKRNVFPEMNVGWGTYPNHIGHTDYPGCFRCHDGEHASPDGKSISQDCNTCHRLLAMEEATPKILEDLGMAEK